MRTLRALLWPMALTLAWACTANVDAPPSPAPAAAAADVKPTGVQLAEAAFERGRAHFESGEFPQAVTELETAIALEGSRAVYHFWLGRSLAERVHHVPFFSQLPMAKRILTSFETAVELDPDDVEARVALVRYYVQAPPLAGGDRAVARRQADEVLRRHPGWGALMWGEIHRWAGELELAEERFRASLEADGDRSMAAEAHWSLGSLYELQGARALAAAEYEAVLGLDPVHEEAEEALARLAAE